MRSDKVWDYIVVGGGSAGCIVAARLAEMTEANILLLEAGRSDEADPLALQMSRLDDQDSSYDWGYVAAPVQGKAGRIKYARAIMLGGCANHNDCAFLPPPMSDLDRWASMGASGWDAASMQPALAAIEGRLNVESAPQGTSLSRAFIDAGLVLGLPFREYRSTIGPGAGWFPLNATGDLRQSSSVGYLHPLDDAPSNLDVRTNIKVTRVLMEHGRAVGVETPGGSLACCGEVILCAGSINTPHLLMLSGIGPAQHLKSHGIAVHADVPGVGRNLVDHVAANIVYELHKAPPQWLRTPCEAVITMQVDDTAGAPDLLFHFIPQLREKYLGEVRFGGARHGFKISPNVTRPKSRGWIELASADPDDKPLINLNYLSDPEGYDLKTLVHGLRQARRLGQSSALSHWAKRELAPGPDVISDDDLADYARDNCETVYHPAGTCRMGDESEADTVVLPDLKVKGVAGLRVVDASVFPDMITVNINNTVMMIGEHGAQLIAKDWQAQA